MTEQHEEDGERPESVQLGDRLRPAGHGEIVADALCPTGRGSGGESESSRRYQAMPSVFCRLLRLTFQMMESAM